MAQGIMTEYHAQVAEVNEKFVQRLEELQKPQHKAPSLSTEERARLRRQMKHAE